MDIAKSQRGQGFMDCMDYWSTAAGYVGPTLLSSSVWEWKILPYYLLDLT